MSSAEVPGWLLIVADHIQTPVNYSNNSRPSTEQSRKIKARPTEFGELAQTTEGTETMVPNGAHLHLGQLVYNGSRIRNG